MSIIVENHISEQVISGGFFRRTQIMDGGGDGVFGTVERENGSGLDPCSSSSSSSIGMNSDDDDDDKNNNNDNIDNSTSNDDDDDDGEVESKLKNSGFDSAVDALEQALPIRRGISNFYNGKSKSFASLADAACSSIKDIEKTENPYSRKRKNLLAHSLYNQALTTSPLAHSLYNQALTTSPKSTGFGPIRSQLPNRESHIEEHDPVGEVNRMKSFRNRALPPVPTTSWRSFSHADLQHCAVSIGALNSKLGPTLMGKRSKHDEVS